jgi:hypothetical protein
MKKHSLAKVSGGCLVCLLILLAGCCINIGSCCREKQEWTDRLRAPLAPGSALAAETSFGSITVTGADVNYCDVTAEVCVQAPSKKEAQEIAKKVKIKLEPIDKTLTLKVEKPHLECNRSVAVSFNITVPKQTDIECTTSFGSIKLTSIDGNIKSETSFASITCENVSGSAYLETSYGSITCRNITLTDLTARSSFGGIDIVCSPSTPPQINVDAATSYGGISFVTPPRFAGQVSLATSFGSIKTDLPITVKGSLNEENIKGTIGQGNGKLNLKTSFGSIELR